MHHNDDDDDDDLCVTLLDVVASTLWQQLPLRDVSSGEQDGDGGDDGEDEEQNETESIDDHRSELPVAADRKSRLVVAQLPGEQSQLAQNRTQSAATATAAASAAASVAALVLVDGRRTLGEQRADIDA